MDIDELFHQQAWECDRRKREIQLHRIPRLTVDQVLFAPIMDMKASMSAPVEHLDGPVSEAFCGH